MARASNAVLLVLLLALPGCPTPDTPYTKANEAAREMNMAARWGRMDIATERADPKTVVAFMKRHAKWHGEIRIVDTELAGIVLTAPTKAEAEVDVSWTFEDDTNLRVTRIHQKWHSIEGKWYVLKEERQSGAKGLFGEEIERKEKPKDTHFPTRVIRE